MELKKIPSQFTRIHAYCTPEAPDDPSYYWGKRLDGRGMYFRLDDDDQIIPGRGCDAVLYRLPELLISPSNVLTWCEGQKDADTLMERGELATSFQGLSLSDHQLVEQIELVSRGRENIVIPDNDEAGWRQADRFSKFLANLRAFYDQRLEVSNG